MFVVLRLVLHSFYVPVFEGPDEPFHLARASAFVDQPVTEALAGLEVDGSIVAAIKAYPCGPDLSHAYGCSEFDGSDAAFNILATRPSLVAAETSPNYEAHQPIVFYAVAGSVLRIAASLLPSAQDPVSRLLMVRLLAVFLVTVAICWPLRLITRTRQPAFALVCALLLLTPGAAESLARCANDAAVFLWTAFLMLIVDRRASTGRIAALLALGPLIKLTTLPIVAFALVWIWRDRGFRSATIGAAASAAFLPIQWIRGWAWGGTVELNVAAGVLDESIRQLIVGMGRTVYTFVKTIFWLGEWSFFRPPVFLLVSGGLLLLLWLLSLRLRTAHPDLPPFSVGIAVMALSFLAFAIKHRLYFHTWGGVGGWYAWGWFPWILVGINDLFDTRPTLQKVAAILGIVLLIVANVLWTASAHRIYGM
jgi:hypothetical protein